MQRNTYNENGNAAQSTRQQTKQNQKQRVFKTGNKFRLNLFHWRGHRKIHRPVKDRLFRFLFEKDKEALLQLYNALNGTNYEDASKLQVVTIESAVYIAMKNDLAFVIAGTLNLYEHQSAFNPNMPVRFLIYLAQEYQKLIEQAEESLYGTKQISLPTPQCIVFYNGEREMPEEDILRLSDAFENKKQMADVELTVRVLNINYGHNREIMDKCGVLAEYSEFVDITRRYIAEGMDRQEAFNETIDYCIDHNILSEFLKKNRAEVLGMLLETFDVKKYERSLRTEGFEEGKEEGLLEGREKGLLEGREEGLLEGREEGLLEGREEGLLEGKREGEERFARLTLLLLDSNRNEDLTRAITDKTHRDSLYQEYGL